MGGPAILPDFLESSELASLIPLHSGEVNRRQDKNGGRRERIRRSVARPTGFAVFVSRDSGSEAVKTAQITRINLTVSTRSWYSPGAIPGRNRRDGNGRLHALRLREKQRF